MPILPKPIGDQVIGLIIEMEFFVVALGIILITNGIYQIRRKS